MKRLRSTVLFLCAGVALSSATYVVGIPASKAKSLANTVLLIIRHAEKPESGDGLTPIGEKRALRYVQYFKNYKIGGKPLAINHLVAASDSEESHRPRLTLEPLANSLHKTLDLRFSDKDPEALVQALKSSHMGHEIVICWRHGKIPALLSALGADPATFIPEGKWPGAIYDRVIELHFDGQGKVDSKDCRLVHEHLMPGDER